MRASRVTSVMMISEKRLPPQTGGTVKTLANKKRVSFNAMMNEQRLLSQTGVTVRTPANKKRTRFKKLRELTTVTDLIR